MWKESVDFSSCQGSHLSVSSIKTDAECCMMPSIRSQRSAWRINSCHSRKIRLIARRPEIRVVRVIRGESKTWILNYSSFANMLTSCNTKPQRGVTMVASRFNGWCKADRKKRAFRYATSNTCRVPTARYPSTSSLPAIEMAGYHCQMPTASLTKLQWINVFLALARDKIMKKWTESTANGCNFMCCSLLSCSRFFEIDAFCSRFIWL